MAMPQLETVLDALKLLPLDLTRSLQLMATLDSQVASGTVSSEQLGAKLLEQWSTSSADSNAKLERIKIDELRQIRDKQQSCASLCAEKLSIAKQIRDVVVSYIQRIDEDLEYIAAEAPSGALDLYTDSNAFEDMYGGGRRGPASKGLLASKAPRELAEKAPHGGGYSAYSASGAPRRKSAAYALDNMVAGIDSEGDTDWDDGNSSVAAADGYHDVTAGLAATGMADTVAMDDLVDDGKADNTLYCICQQPSYGNMVGCDNPQCKIEWFHFACVGLKAHPKGKWYCPDCSATRYAAAAK